MENQDLKTQTALRVLEWYLTHRHKEGDRFKVAVSFAWKIANYMVEGREVSERDIDLLKQWEQGKPVRKVKKYPVPEDDCFVNSPKTEKGEMKESLLFSMDDHAGGVPFKVVDKEFCHYMVYPKTSIGKVCEERNRQILDKGYDAGWDNQHKNDQLAFSARAYLDQYLWDVSEAKKSWPFDTEFKPGENAMDDLKKAAALIIAEMDRLERFNENTGE